MQTLNREQVQSKLQDADVALIEVLPRESFQKFHLPGAVNVPVDDGDFDAKIASVVPERSTPTIVYCADKDCNASPRAAKRLEELGYEEVYDYEAGKEDWKAAGNRIESSH